MASRQLIWLTDFEIEILKELGVICTLLHAVLLIYHEMGSNKLYGGNEGSEHDQAKYGSLWDTSAVGQTMPVSLLVILANWIDKLIKI